MDTVIWWVRRDLRLVDNQALAAALAAAAKVVPVFVLDPALLESERVGPRRAAFLLGSLRALDADLRARGSYLVVRRGDPATELAALVAETGAGAIFAEEDYTPYAQQRDNNVGATHASPLHLMTGRLVHPPEAVLKADGTPYTVFTPFSRRWRALPLPGAPIPAPDRIAPPASVRSLPIPTEPALPSAVPFSPGEGEAQRRLRAFAAGDDPPVYRYAALRDRMDVEGTSQLSPYLHLGVLSSRQVVATALAARAAAPDDAARASADTWLNELIWREFYVHVLAHFPHVVTGSFRREKDAIAWENDEAAFAAWREGRTGYPAVDAAMHQLNETGWMHNRARMIAASFLVKDLLVDWRWGERYFMQALVDGDTAANNGGWQWSAGTGTDAAPYFRVFNPVLQGKKYDPEGAYARRWVPELARVPNRYLHEPWKMPESVQRSAGCVVGQDYTAPIIDHQWARQRVLAVYRNTHIAAGQVILLVNGGRTHETGVES